MTHFTCCFILAMSSTRFDLPDTEGQSRTCISFISHHKGGRCSCLWSCADNLRSDREQGDLPRHADATGDAHGRTKQYAVANPLSPPKSSTHDSQFPVAQIARTDFRREGLRSEKGHAVWNEVYLDHFTVAASLYIQWVPAVAVRIGDGQRATRVASE